jgi:hypothetical protein
MANYAIMRIEKIKEGREGSARLKHMRRETPCKTVSHPERTNYRISYGGVDDCVGRQFGDIFRDRTAGQNVRKNAVRAVEVVLTFSPGAVKDDQLKEWAWANMQWLGGLFGDKNIIGAMLHMDEETPHIHAMVIPIDERGKLNARAFLGGTSQRMRDLQTDYARSMAAFGLERGLDKKVTKARHKSTAAWRAELADNAARLATYEKVYGKPMEMKFDDMVRFSIAEGEIRAQQLADDAREPQGLDQTSIDTSDPRDV